MEDSFLKQEDNVEYWRAEYEALLKKYYEVKREVSNLRAERDWLRTLRDLRGDHG